MADAITMRPIAHIVNGITEVADDCWGGTEAIIRIDNARSRWPGWKTSPTWRWPLPPH